VSSDGILIGSTMKSGLGALSICILNYKTPQLVIDCLASFLPDLAGDAAVVIADSCSQDGSVEKIGAWLKGNDGAGRCRLIALPVNGGFSAGYNAAMKAARADFYLLLNSDTVVRPGAIARLLEAAAEYPQAGLFGPRLEWPRRRSAVSATTRPSVK
jgi:N-acetylglucosaminyl-diphospho-decaprenol L-rhamnosyltransferase